jgi:hypothetical protein
MEDDIKITRNTQEIIEAEIKNYNMTLDLKAKRLRHDCDDWRKGADSKRLCKHLNKLFLILPPGQSRKILEKMWEDRDDWNFE